MSDVLLGANTDGRMKKPGRLKIRKTRLKDNCPDNKNTRNSGERGTTVFPGKKMLTMDYQIFGMKSSKMSFERVGSRKLC